MNNYCLHYWDRKRCCNSMCVQLVHATTRTLRLSRIKVIRDGKNIIFVVLGSLEMTFQVRHKKTSPNRPSLADATRAWKNEIKCRNVTTINPFSINTHSKAIHIARSSEKLKLIRHQTMNYNQLNCCRSSARLVCLCGALQIWIKLFFVCIVWRFYGTIIDITVK